MLCPAAEAEGDRAAQLRGLRQVVQHVQQPGATPADSPLARRQEGETLSALRQGVCEHAGLQHARAHAQPGLQVLLLRQELLPTMAAAGSHPYSHR